MRLNVVQSVLETAGVQAGRIEWLWWVFLAVAVVVWVLVMVALAIGVARANRRGAPEVTSQGDARAVRAIGVATGATVVTLLVLLTTDAVIGRQIAAERGNDDPHGVLAEPRGPGDALQVRVTGNQWWWDIEYQHPDPSLRVRTANELHLPVGRTVRIQLMATDVIHSFWVPALHGKRDAIPGHDTYLWLRADRAGVFRGQCAEFCGLQHAHMAFTVVAEDGDAFERWISGQRPAAPTPTTEVTARGRNVVERGACAMCHTIRGTTAGARTAPDLTHVATRSTLAAGTLPNTRGHLAGWLSDPQSVKPGTRMPIVGLAPDDLDAVLAYLETLK